MRSKLNRFRFTTAFRERGDRIGVWLTHATREAAPDVLFVSAALPTPERLRQQSLRLAARWSHVSLLRDCTSSIVRPRRGAVKTVALCPCDPITAHRAGRFSRIGEPGGRSQPTGAIASRRGHRDQQAYCCNVQTLDQTHQVDLRPVSDAAMARCCNDKIGLDE